MNRSKKIGFTFIKNEITNSVWVARFLNKLTIDGKKSKTEKFVYNSFILLKKHKINASLNLFYAFELLRPLIYTRPFTARGKVKLVPTRLGIEEQYNRALTWFAQSVKSGKEKVILGRFLRELFKIVVYKRSSALKQKRRVYKTVIKNRTLINFRF